MENLINQIELYVDVPYLLTFILLSYLVKRYFQSSLTRIIGSEFKTVYVVLILAALVAVPYVLWGDVSWQKAVVTYCVGTSLHETIFYIIENKFKAPVQ